MPNVGEFQLSVTRALRDQLLTALDALDTGSLTESNLAAVARRPGVYQLFISGNLVYVGKAAANLRGRLEKHFKKLSGRTGNPLTYTSFKCIYISEDMDAIAPELMLIAHYRAAGEAPWNFNGFGNNDPGKERDTSLVESDHFDSLYPIDLDMEIDFRVTGSEPLAAAMRRFKGRLPFLFRFASVPGNLAVERPGSPITTARGWIAHFAAALPDAWSVVALPGYVIAYPSRPAEQFASRIGTWERNPDGTAAWRPHIPEFDSSSTADAAEADGDETEDE